MFFLTKTPAHNGTIALYGNNEVIVIANTASSITFRLPTVTAAMRLGRTIVKAGNILAGVITIQDPTGVTTLGTVDAGTVGEFTLAANGVWYNSGSASGDVDVTASDVPIVDAGGFYTATHVEDALTEIHQDVLSVLSGLASTSPGAGASLIGVRDALSIFTGTTVEGVLTEIVANLTAITPGNGASRVGFEDSLGYTTADTVNAALNEIYTSFTAQERIDVPLTSITAEDGTVLIKQAGTTPGWNQISGKNVGLVIPINSTIENFAASRVTPRNVDIDLDDQITLNVVVSKNSNNDALTLDAEMYALHTAGGWGDNGHITDPTTIPQAVTTLSFTPEISWISGFTATIQALSFVLSLAGTNDQDVVNIHEVYWLYKKRLLVS